MRRHFLLIIITVFALGLIIWEEIQNRQPLVESSTEAVMVDRDARAIPAINDPQFESVKTADAHLSDDGLGIGLEVNGVRRFYPYQILAWHEIVNETFGGIELVITYSPLSGSAVVFLRELNGKIYTFENSRKLLNNTLVMKDKETGMLWPQLKNDLVIYPSNVTTWAKWKEANVYGSVLSRQTGYEMDYTSSPYIGYESSADIFYPLTSLDGRLSPKTLVSPRDGIVSYWFAWTAFYPETELIEPFAI
ncbi:MAG: DUF3179 domain-containing (seleno)protein [Patescibacteria group bacterium]